MAFGDERGEPVDLIVGLDKSLSMDDKIEAVKQFVINYLIKDILIINDYFLVIEFYEKAQVAAADYIYSEQDKENLVAKISAIRADGKWTDIGNAFDRLRDELLERMNNGRKKVFLFISDGVNEPPRTSKYFSSDRKLKHEYIAKLSEFLNMPNWKAQILNIGDNLELEALAKQLKGDAHKFDLEGKNNQFEVVGTMEVDTQSLKDLKVSNDGKGALELTVKSQRYNEPQKLSISSIKLETGGNQSKTSSKNPLKRRYRLSVKPSLKYR